MSTAPPRGRDPKARLAELLAETLIKHAPHTAAVNAAVKTKAVSEWLDGLEAHAASFVGPFLQRVLDSTDPPAEVRSLLEEAISPTAAFSASIEQIFLWGIISSIISAAVAPFLIGLSNDLNAAAVGERIARPTDPGTIATAVGRGLNYGDPATVTVPDWAYTRAAQNGINRDDVNLMASIIGLPPSLQELFEMYRRGIIESTTLGPPKVSTGQTPALDSQGNPLTVEQGLREGDFRDDWIGAAAQLVHAWLSPADFVRAAIQAQLPYDVARDWAEATGLDVTTPIPLDVGSTEATPDNFGLAFALGGRPPGVEELGRMANRGIIDWTGTGTDQTTFQQGVAESDVKTKWTPALQALQQYVPPPRQVGTLYEHGAITEDQAIQYWEDGGVPNALAQGYLYVAQQQHTNQEKLLAKGDITTAYYDGILTHDQAIQLLEPLGYTGDVAADILAISDARREIRAIDSVVTKVGTLYQNFRLSSVDALQALEVVGVDPGQAQSLLNYWSIIRVEPVRVPTAAQVGAAVRYGTLTQAQALAMLADLGYQPLDAAVVLSAGAEAQVTPLPAAGTTTTG